MTTGRLGQQAAPPNAAYAGQVVHFPDPVRAARHPGGVRVDERGYPGLLAVCACRRGDRRAPGGLRGRRVAADGLRVGERGAAPRRGTSCGARFPRWRRRTAGRGTTWRARGGWSWCRSRSRRCCGITAGSRRRRSITRKRGTRPLQETRPAHFGLPKASVAVAEQQVLGVEEDLGYRLPGAYRVVPEGGGRLRAGGCGAGRGAGTAGGPAVLHRAGRGRGQRPGVRQQVSARPPDEGLPGRRPSSRAVCSR